MIDTIVASALLDQEIRNHHGGLRNSLATRKAHPTYGVTKTDLWMRLHRLEGLLYARGMVDGHRSAAFDLQVQEVASTFDIDLTALRIQIKNA
jgi:hypothetical protein